MCYKEITIFNYKKNNMKTIWEERTSQLLAELEGKTLEEKANILRSLCHSHYCAGYSDGNTDGS